MRIKQKCLSMLTIPATAFLGLSAFGQITLQPIGTFASGVFDESAAEIVAFDPASQKLFVTNAFANRLDIIDISDPTNPTGAGTIDLSDFGEGPTSVATGSEIAVAVLSEPATDPGKVVFFRTDGSFLSVVTVGSHPDSLTFTPDGTWVIVANEGEPTITEENTVDPEGSVSIIDVSGGAENVTQADVCTADFQAFNGQEDVLRAAGIRIFGQDHLGNPDSAAQDLEPEGVTVSDDSTIAWVALQENNAVAEVDIGLCVVTGIFPLGFTDHSVSSNGFDASDEDDAINITPWPVKGMYQPDGIAAFRPPGGLETFLVTANEGDARDFEGFSEEATVSQLNLCAGAFPGAATLQKARNLGRLTVTTFPPSGISSEDGVECFEEIFSFGARSFSIFDTAGSLVFDSGRDFEEITAAQFPNGFNSSNDENDPDERSDNKGPEPEGVVVGEISGRIYAFIGLERIGGIMTYDITEPMASFFVDYVNIRDFSVTDEAEVEAGLAGDLGPEGLLFIPTDSSPIPSPLLVVAHEVSGTTTIFEIVSTP